MAKSFMGLCLVLLLCLALGQSRRVSDHTYNLQPSSSCTPSSRVPKSKSWMKVVHKYGPCSHLDQHGTAEEIAREIVRQDISRVELIMSRFSGETMYFEEKTKLTANSGRKLGSGNYYVTVGLGTPTKELSLVFDTGSDLTWTQCQPCIGGCYTQQDPIFDPSASTSYANQTCSSQTCSLLKSQPACSGSDPAVSTCIYGVEYLDESKTVGFLATETLTLTPSDAIQNFIFGCGQENIGRFHSTAGILGLGRDDTSIVQQASAEYGQKFSYCLPTTTSSSDGYLTLGPSSSAAKIETPMLTLENDQHAYALTIDAFVVNGTAVPTQGMKTIIDSGAVITQLPTEVYAALRDEFKKHMTQYATATGETILDTCFDKGAYPEFLVPQMSIVYGGGATVDLPRENVLYSFGESKACLAFSAKYNIAILGNTQQKGFDVSYDVAGAKIGFTPNACL